MKRTIGLVPASLLIFTAFTVGAAGMWVRERMSSFEEVWPSARLAHELEVTGLCANGLALDGAGDRDRLKQLLAQRLDRALDSASTLTDQGANMPVAWPNLRDSVRRAADYYAASGDGDRRRRAEALLTALPDAK